VRTKVVIIILILIVGVLYLHKLFLHADIERKIDYLFLFRKFQESVFIARQQTTTVDHFGIKTKKMRALPSIKRRERVGRTSERHNSICDVNPPADLSRLSQFRRFNSFRSVLRAREQSEG
jgi:hypothetical protein